MRILITAGPTREPIDAVRFITNASSGRMGCAVASAAVEAGHDVTLLCGPMAQAPPPGCRVREFQTVAELKALLGEAFGDCDALVMAAAVGDFRVESPVEGKLHRSAGPVDIRLVPTEDVVAGVTANRKPGQVVVVFAVEEGSDTQIEQQARGKLLNKGADVVVANTLDAMASDQSKACILSSDVILADWQDRPKKQLAQEIVRAIEQCAGKNPT